MLRKLVNAGLSRNKQNLINMITSITNMLVTTLISFFLSPYIVKTLGVEANGFVSLANQFIAYASLACTALNSMASRFIMIAYYNDDREKVNKYYSSLFIGDSILAILFGIIGAVCVWKLEIILEIPNSIVKDVKILFLILFVNFIISTLTTVWNVVPYIKNKLYLDSIATALTAVFRCMVIFGLFMCLSPSVCFVGIGTMIAGCISYILHFYYKRLLLPDLRISIKKFSWGAIKELVSAGIWNSISSLGSILTNGLDLLVANLFIGSTQMGVLAIAKTMPAFVSSLNETIANVFTPSLIIDYAHNDRKSIVKTIKQSSKMISVICSLPLAFLLIFGNEFYCLWQPTEDARILHILSVITIFGRVLFTGMQPLFNVFTVVNKVKQNSLITVLNGFISIIVTFILLNTTDLGIYAVAGVSVVCCLFKNILFVIPYAAKYLELKKTAFYNTLIPSISSTSILCLWGVLLKTFIQCNSWIMLIITGIVFSVVGFILTSLVVLNRQERYYLYNIILSKVKR